MKKYIEFDTTYKHIYTNGFDVDTYKMTFEDFCDFRFVDRLSDEELKDFVRNSFKKKYGSALDIKFIEVDPEAWLDCKDVIINREDKDCTFIIYSINLRRDEEPDEDDDCYSFYKQQPPEVEIMHYVAEVAEFFEWHFDVNECGVSLREMYSERESVYFSDFTLRKNKDFGMISWPTWVIDADYLIFMTRKFGLEYTNQLFNTRKAYREYYIHKEKEIKSECVRLMKENTHPILGVKSGLVKTTDKFIDSTPEEVLRAFHYWYKWEPHIIDVTNFQSLKNEDISPENKDRCGRTILRRLRFGKDNNGMYSIEEFQSRQETTRINANGEYVKVYPKKNNPVHQDKRYFRDFVFGDGDLNESILMNESVDRLKYSEWTGIMYSAFGEPYQKALEKTFDDKLLKWLRNYDGTTYVLTQFIDSLGQNTKKIDEAVQSN